MHYRRLRPRDRRFPLGSLNIHGRFSEVLHDLSPAAVTGVEDIPGMGSDQGVVNVVVVGQDHHRVAAASSSTVSSACTMSRLRLAMSASVT